MKVLLTGANGFIGKNLQLHLAERADVEGRAAPFLRSGKIIPALYADPIKESKAKSERSFYKR